jgi:hypothetical protein
MFLSNINSLSEILPDKNFNQEGAECEGCEGSEASTGPINLMNIVIYEGN